MEIFRKRNEATGVVFPLIDSANRPAFKTVATLAAGDVKIISHSAGAWQAAANTATTTPTELGLGYYYLPLTAAELNPDNSQYPVIIVCHDAVGAQWDDQSIVIWTRDVDMDDVMLAGSYVAPPTVAAIRTEMDMNSADLNAIIAYVDELESRLTAARAPLLDNLSNLDAMISSRLASAAYITPPTVSAIADQVWDEAAADHNIAGTAGAAIAKILAGGSTIMVTSPVASNGDIEIYQGADYATQENRALEWTDPTGAAWPDLTNATVTVHIGESFSKAATVITPTGANKKVRLDLAAADTAALRARTYGLYIEALLANNHQIPLLVGSATVLQSSA
ncbi:MAG: hypothetical protein M1343_08385 [Chloroflexi bacterium]|nr:hypothetical protein [Chloroflexota bacterium]